MSGPRIFVDGHVGTTGLRIRTLLEGRDDLEILTLEEGRRKDPAARSEVSNEADLVVLCLPDDAAREAVARIERPGVRVIDASTAHRTAEGWVYGFPELGPGQRRRIAEATRVTNPGCYPTGILALVRPLVEEGLLPADAPLAIHALSGYSGGGRALIERWEDESSGLLQIPYEAPYALERVHKHVAETVRYGRLAREPQLVPAVGPFRCGMRVELPLPSGILAPGVTGKVLWEALDARYRDERFVRVHPFEDPFVADEGTLDPRRCNDTNRIELWAIAHPSGHALLVACLDNLGKGAAGAAVQNLNLMLGLPEARGLVA